MEEPLSYRVQLRLFKRGKCFGRGIAELLTRVSRTGSLRSAAAEMDMAYSKAWRIIKNSEDILAKTAVARCSRPRRGICWPATSALWKKGNGRWMLSLPNALKG